MKSWTLVLDPDRAGLWDLFLGSRLLLRRAAYREIKNSGRVASETELRTWTKMAVDELIRRYPKILLLDGLHHPDVCTEPPLIEWTEAPFERLNAAQLKDSIHLLHVPKVEFHGSEQDMVLLVEAIETGRFPLETFAELPGLHVATLPVQLSVAHTLNPRMEHIEEFLTRKQDVQQTLINCYKRKSEGLFEAQANPRRLFSGMHLDTTRLARAAVARRTGKRVKLFRSRAHDYQRLFDPFQHLVVRGTDLNSLFSGPAGRPRWSAQGEAIMAAVFQKLGTDYSVFAFRDRLLTCGDGRQVYLHLPTKVKDYTDPFDAAFWNHLAHALDPDDGGFPGERAGLATIQLRTLVKEVERIAKVLEHPYRTIMLSSVHGMPTGSEFQDSSFLIATAEMLEQQLEMVHEQYAGRRIDTDFVYVCQDVKDHGRPGGRVIDLPTL
ncbi:MAG: hypothetical protein RIC55_00090 [Pirellulaceae bacterium]